MRLYNHNIIIIFFLNISFIKCKIYYIIFDLKNSWKNLLFINKKMKKKNQIFEYYISSFKKDNKNNI